MKRIWAVPVLATILLLGVVAVGSSTQAFAGVPPGGPGPDVPPFHLKCYNDLEFGLGFGFAFFEVLQVILGDQFGNEIVPDFVPVIDGFCASAVKLIPPQIFDDPFALGHHVTTYPISGESLNVRVELTDQFGTFTHNVFEPTKLLVPASKFKESPGGLTAISPPLLDVHWKCYGIDGESLKAPLDFSLVQLDDQFGSTTDFTLTPVELCTPATKTITLQGKSESFTNEFPPEANVHLKCYTVEPQNVIIGASFQDQILSSPLIDSAFVDKLCVTVEKTVLASIHGMKWNDLNGNGIKEPPGEPGISGWKIELECDDGFSASTTTDDDGNYWFFDIPAPNRCTVTEEIRTTWNPTTPTSLTVFPNPGDRIEDQNFGNQLIITPPEDDHYLAYKVKEVKNTPKFELLQVDLTDQFGTGIFNVTKPNMLYNPVVGLLVKLLQSIMGIHIMWAIR